RVFPLDLEAAEKHYSFQKRDASKPDKSFERRWALTVLDCALASLRSTKHFDRLKPFLTGEDSEISYALLSTELGISEGAVKVAIHRLRRRFAESLREEIARTVASPVQVDGEIRYLMTALRG